MASFLLPQSRPDPSNLTALRNNHAVVLDATLPFEASPTQHSNPPATQTRRPQSVLSRRSTCGITDRHEAYLGLSTCQRPPKRRTKIALLAFQPLEPRCRLRPVQPPRRGFRQRQVVLDIAALSPFVLDG